MDNMEDSEKTKEQLINELAKLGQQITKLKESEIKRKKAEEDLKKSQQEFASLFKNSPEALVYTDEKGKILDINPNFTALFGYTLKKIKGRNIDDGMITPPDKMKEAKKLTSEALKEDFYFETMRKKKNGTLFPVAISGSRVIIGGRFKGLIASYRDITEHQKMIEDLKNSEEKYRSLYENMPGVYYRADREGNILMVNSPGAKLLGYNSPEEIIGKNLVKDFYYIPEDRKIFLEELKKRKGIVKDYVATLKRRDGTPIVVSISSHYCYDEKGNIIGVEGIFVDITEHKEAEMAIIYEQSLLLALMENISDHIYFKDKKKRFIRVNKAKAEYSEKTTEKMIGNTDFDFFPPEIAKQSSADDDLVIETGKPIIDKVEKIIHLNKTEHWFSTTKVPWYNREGKITGLIGISRNITERKKAEEALQKSQQEFASLFNSSPEALVYVDAKSNIVNINPCFTELFGYTLEELQGRNIDEGIIHPADKKEEGLRLNRIVKGFSNYETIRKRKDDTLIQVSISSSSVIVDNQIRGFLILYKDITERKQNEIMQKVLYNISQAANSSLSLKQLYKTIHKELGSIIDTTNFYIALIGEKEDKIFFPYNIDSAKPIHLPRTIKDNSLVAQVIRSGKSTFVNREMIKEKKSMTKFKEWFGTLHKVWLGVPLKIEDKTIGAMVVHSYTDPNLYSEKDIRLLEFVSNQISTVIERKKMEKELERLAHYDVLTGSCSRGYGLNLLEQQIKTAKRKKTPILLLYLDVDTFKNINDTFGHQEGDKVLKEAAKLFKSTLREVDIICRIGGDEFLLIFPENSLNDATLIRERLNKNLEKLNQKRAKPYKIDLSIGLSCYNPSKPQPMDELIRIADEKMYEEKRRKNKGR
jgi:diguanylate cyclase (GGDEF)-like protein/PAS domain S-box-containing protein